MDWNRRPPPWGGRLLGFVSATTFLRYAGLAGNIYSPSRGHEHVQQGRPNQYHPGTGLADL